MKTYIQLFTRICAFLKRRELKNRVSSGWVVHPDFSTPRAEFDLAIVFLEDPFELNDSVQLAVRAEERPGEGELATLAGWGKDEDGGNPFVGADVPYKITRPILDEQVHIWYFACENNSNKILHPSRW